MQKNDQGMTANDVIEIVRLLDQHSIDVCVDGGWGVDALLGEQTRVHADLDLAIHHKDVAETRALLEERGFKDVPRDDTRDCNFVLGDSRGRRSIFTLTHLILRVSLFTELNIRLTH